MKMSLSSRRAWIEIEIYHALHDSVNVALLAEGVDRNFFTGCSPKFANVALLAEGVDRNRFQSVRHLGLRLSLSSRRAWIEIVRCFLCHIRLHVALLAEGVDRNILSTPFLQPDAVALLAEGVDRNNVNTSAIIRMTTRRSPRGGRG